MRKITVLICLLASYNCYAQKDFDYTIYTNNAVYDTVLGRLTLFRKIQKDANVIRIISLVNTGDTQTFTVQYLGWNAELNEFLYDVVEDGKRVKKILRINPVAPKVTLISGDIETVYY